MSKFNSFLSLGLLVATSVLLSACGGSEGSDSSPENGDSSSSENTLSTINANDISTLIYENKISTVSVLGAVNSDHIAQTKLSSVSSVTGEKSGCSIIDGSVDEANLSFNVESSDPSLCLYQYQVTNTQTQEMSTAIAQVGVVSTEADLLSTTQLEPIPKVVQPADTIDIKLNVGDDETLLESNVVLVGAGSISVDEQTNTITYTAAEEGSYRIYYSLVNAAQTSVKTGDIDLAVADLINHGTEANNFRYLTANDAASGLSYTLVDPNQEVTIDVSPYISDPDIDDDLTLTDVKAYNASTQIVSADQFTFLAKTEGTYYATYTIADGNGGFDIGIVEIKVGSPWNDVLVTSISKQFLAPISYDAAVDARLSFSGIASELSGDGGNGVANVPTYSYEEANIICQAKGGFLPSKSELEAFEEQEGNPFISGDGSSNEMAKDWPIQRAYFSHTEDDANSEMVYAYNGNTKQVELVDKSSYQYLMCVEGSSIALSMDSNFYLILNEENPLSLSYSVNGENISDYTNTTLWQQGSLNDLSHTPELSSSDVSIEDNKVTPTLSGWINISASAQEENLYATRDYRVTDNILNVEGADPTLDSDAITATDSCLETIIPSSSSLTSGFMSAGTDGTVSSISNCPDSYTGLSTNTFYKFSPTDGLPDARLELESSKRVTLGKGNYTMSFWSKFVLAEPKQITMEASLYLDSDSDNLITCSIDNAGNMGGVNATLAESSNDWNKVSCDVSITTQGTYAFRLLARDNYTNETASYVYADEPQLLPKR